MLAQYYKVFILDPMIAQLLLALCQVCSQDWGAPLRGLNEHIEPGFRVNGPEIWMYKLGLCQGGTVKLGVHIPLCGRGSTHLFLGEGLCA